MATKKNQSPVCSQLWQRKDLSVMHFFNVILGSLSFPCSNFSPFLPWRKWRVRRPAWSEGQSHWKIGEQKDESRGMKGLNAPKEDHTWKNYGGGAGGIWGGANGMHEGPEAGQSLAHSKIPRSAPLAQLGESKEQWVRGAHLVIGRARRLGGLCSPCYRFYILFYKKWELARYSKCCFCFLFFHFFFFLVDLRLNGGQVGVGGPMERERCIHAQGIVWKDEQDMVID